MLSSRRFLLARGFEIASVNLAGPRQAVSERSIAEWAARAAGDDDPFPERRAGVEPRDRREGRDAWTEREQSGDGG